MRAFRSLLKTSLCSVVLSFPLLTANANELPDILQSGSPEYLPDFSYAGYKFGLEPIVVPNSVELRAVDFGAIADDGKDDTAALKAVLSRASEIGGPVLITLPKGRLMLTEVLNIDRSHLVIRGQGRGENGSSLYMPRPLAIVGDDGKLDELREYLIKYDKRQRSKAINLDHMFSEYSWTGGFLWVGKDGARPAPYLEENDVYIQGNALSNGVRGQKTLKVADGANLSVGDRVQILWYNKQGKDAGIIRSLYGPSYKDLKVGSHHWTFPNRALVKQRTVITGVTADQITIADTLLHDVSNAVPAELLAWEPLEHIGIEDIRFEFPDSPYFGHHMEQGYNGIYMTGAADSWVRNVAFVNADSGIISYDSANLTFENIDALGNHIAHYGVHMGNVHNVLAKNIRIFNPVTHSLTFNTQSTRSVYKDALVMNSAVLDQHAGANHQNLFDNVTLHFSAEPKNTKEPAHYPVFDGSGAGYWQPGHGRYNTTWNLELIVEDGASSNETVTIQGLAEGPDARIIGLYGNRNYKLDYRPEPYSAFINQSIARIPSLYDYQLYQRLK